MDGQLCGLVMGSCQVRLGSTQLFELIFFMSQKVNKCISIHPMATQVHDQMLSPGVTRQEGILQQTSMIELVPFNPAIAASLG